MIDLWQNLKNSSMPIYLYGMGNGADKIISALDSLDIRVSGVFVSDGFVRDKTFHGFRLQSYSQVCEKEKDFTVIVCFGSSRPEVMANIRRISRQHKLLMPDLPVFGSGLFDLEYCKNNKKRLERIYDLLADDISRHTFESLVKFKITGDIDYLSDCEISAGEPYKSFLCLDKDSVYGDLGAYRGDTLVEFINVVGGYKKAYAVEPDTKTFAKLIKTDLPNTVYINAAVSDSEGSDFFAVNSGRGSHLSESGREIPTVSVDSLFKDAPPDYIKMDVEGAEAKALDGAVQTVKAYKPKMCISAYHRAYDLVELPEKVLSMRSDYKIYLRHFPYFPAWDTNYYFV